MMVLAEEKQKMMVMAEEWQQMMVLDEEYILFFLNYVRVIHGYAWTKSSITSE